MYHKNYQHDPKFMRIFRSEVERTGLFVPDTWFKSTTAVIATIKTLSSFLAKYPKHTIGQVVATLAIGLGSAVVAGMIESLATVALAALAVIYVGIILGCFISALWKYSQTGTKCTLKIVFSLVPELNYNEGKRLLMMPEVRHDLATIGFRYAV